MKDEAVLKNLKEAREYGYDLACVRCGCGITDDSDSHDMWCPVNPEYEHNMEMARSYNKRHGITA